MPASLTASTRVVGVIGDPVRHSLSPLLHNAAFAAMRLDWASVAFPVPAGEVGPALAGMRALGVEGLSVTMPHKQAALAGVDHTSETATRLGAINTIVRRNGQLVGENTDGAGFLDAVHTAGCDPVGWRCLILGAGGAARAIVVALAGAGAAEVVVVNRTPTRAEQAAALAGAVGRVGSADEVDRADLVVHATPLGMLGVSPASRAGEQGPTSDQLPLDPARLGPGQLVVDLVYHPRDTPLLKAARDRGAMVQDGVGMLVHQAAHALAFWTGEKPPVAAMMAAVDSAPRLRA
ncbi:MAG: shikimate dehydrogenase [Acidimicrobiales bacterium]|nr:MAG: shikimate dehydrogenase [Acidimicrobiales bacterium]